MDLDGAFDDDQARALAELEHASLDDVLARTRVLEHELRVLRDESNRVNLECQSERERVKDNQEKIKLNKQLPYLVGNVVELLDMAPEEEELEDQATTDVDAQRQGKAVVLKTTTRQTIFLPVVGLVDAETLKPGTWWG